MNCWNLRLWRKAVCFGFAENQEKRVNAAHRRFGGIVKLRVGVTVFSQLLHTLRRARAQIIEPPEHDRLSRTNFGTRRCETALLSVVAEGAFECAAGIGQRLWAPVNHAKWARDDAIPAAVANVVLHEHRPTSVRTIAPVGQASRQPASSQCLQTSERKIQRNGSSPSPSPNECEPTIWPPFCRSCSTNITCRHVDPPRWPVLS